MPQAWARKKRYKKCWNYNDVEIEKSEKLNWKNRGPDLDYKTGIHTTYRSPDFQNHVLKTLSSLHQQKSKDYKEQQNP